jgi:hypothetical protein
MKIQRIIWGALLLGQCGFLTMILTSAIPPPPQRNQNLPHPLVDYLPLAMLLTEVPALYAVRLFLLRRGTRRAVETGNLIFWAGCDGVCFSAMIFAYIGSWSAPLAVSVAIALALQLLTFPR